MQIVAVTAVIIVVLLSRATFDFLSVDKKFQHHFNVHYRACHEDAGTNQTTCEYLEKNYMCQWNGHSCDSLSMDWQTFVLLSFWEIVPTFLVCPVPAGNCL